MNDKVTVSVFQIAEKFPTPEAARELLEEVLWPKGPVCPKCGGQDAAKRKDGHYRCHPCGINFTVRAGTIFENTHIPLHKWIHAMYLLLTARKGISSIQLSKQLSITQKSAWFMLHRLRAACGNELESLSGTVEMDETYIGGKEKNKHGDKKGPGGRGPSGKIPVFGMRQREGHTKAMPVVNTEAATLRAEIEKTVEKGTKLYSDESRSYNGLKGYRRGSVNHSIKEYVRGNVHTNGIESVWAVLKRGLHGVYHKASEKHLARYVNEFSFRLNEGDVEIPTLERIKSLIKETPGRYLPYAVLKASPGDSGARPF